MKKRNNIISSFRDPSGYIYIEREDVFRKIFPCYFKQYEHIIHSGLYDKLVNNKLLICHEEIKRTHDFVVLKVKKIPYISYPYEWCFNELKDAALLTLNILKISLEYDMILKDASGYNIQFLDGKPIFIDTLSFDFYKDGSPWGGYGQFCRHFLGPLLLMSYVDIRSNLLLREFIDGIPIDFCDHILKGRGGLTSRMHVKWHSKSISKYDDVVYKENKMSKKSLINMIDMMIRQIERLSLKKEKTEWDQYYLNTNYDDVSSLEKERLVSDYLSSINIKSNNIIFDIGSNDGRYSRIASSIGGMVISFDNDYNCVNRNYVTVRNDNCGNILPLVMDFNNPSPSIGFANMERDSFNNRGNIKCIMALAVIHHICISNNVSFDMLASWFHDMGEYLIIEFVPKDDSKVVKLLSTRNDIFDWYYLEYFEECFSNYYSIIEKNKIKNSKRVIYLMRRK